MPVRDAGGAPRDERRLAAILAADVAGYSRLMGCVRETVRELEAHQAVILPLSPSAAGYQFAGDGIVAQFPSAVRAVECAVAIQKIMGERNFDVLADRRMLLRIGVISATSSMTTRTYGDGSCRGAARAPGRPDGICISATRPDGSSAARPALARIGENSQNIDRPVHIYQIRRRARARRDWLGGLRHTPLGAGARACRTPAAVAGLAAWRFWPREAGRPEYTPVMAVLPFTNASGDPSLDSGPSLRAKFPRCSRPIRCFGWSRPRPSVARGAGHRRRYALTATF